MAELQLVAAWSFDSNGNVEPWLSRGREAGKTTAMAASVERRDAAMVASMEKKWGEGVSYPVPRKRERNLHTYAQDVEITHIVTI
jgi:hypothetical protein